MVKVPMYGKPKNDGEMTARKYMKLRICNRDGWQCFYCGVEIIDIKQATLDHIIPKCFGGPFDPGNLVLACYDCNQERGNIPANIFLTLKMTA